MRATTTCCLALLCLASLSGTARADVLVVDDSGIFGHHATLQSAVDAANVGDTILVDATLDAAQQTVEIDGKGLSILVDTHDASVTLKKLSVRNLPAGQSLTLRGLRVIAPDAVGMEFTDNAGTLRLYDLGASGKPGVPKSPTQPIARDGSTGALFTNCADVLLRNCGFGGGEGGELYFATDIAASNGGTGCVITNCKIAAYFTNFSGGDGGSIVPILSAAPGGAGGTGLINVDSLLFTHGGGPGGGTGGDTQVAVGGPGGSGYVQSGAGPKWSTYNTGSVGGPGGDSVQAVDGPAGTAQVIQSGTTVQLGLLQTFPRDLWTTTPVREGEPIKVTGIGFQDEFWMLVSFDTGHQLLPGFQGALMIGAPALGGLFFLGPVPLIATEFTLGTVPALPAGLEVFDVQVQAVLKVAGPAYLLGPPEQIVLLDSAY